MNRQFTLDLSPAKARLLLLMSTVNELKLETEIIELAQRGAITEAEARELGLNDIERGALQFLVDTDLRAGLPFETGMEAVAKRIVGLAVRDHEVVSLGEIEDHSFQGLVQHRRKVLLVNLGVESDIAELVGKVFPRIIVYGPITVQYSFPGMGDKQVSTSDAMGRILNPAVQQAITKGSDYGPTAPRSLVAMGVYPGFWATDTWAKQV